LERLGTTEPKIENKAEWKAIREVCAIQLRSKDTTKQKLIARLQQLAVTRPQKANIEEWQKINAVAKYELERLEGKKR
jgi:hypothetical protein